MEYATLLEDIKNKADEDDDEDDEGPDDGDDADGDGDGGWEDEAKVKTKSPFVYSELLSDIIDCGTGLGMGDEDGDGEDDELENESDQAHPLYSVDLKAALESIFRNLAASPGVQARVAGQLSPAEQKTLAAAFQ